MNATAMAARLVARWPGPCAGVATVVTVVLAAASLLGAAPHAVRAAPRCDAPWQHPVSAPIVDQFRPPSNPYGPGNRGIEYNTAVGDPVTAVADGVVRFAGSVGGDGFVVVEHGPELWATYAYLSTIEVSLDELVEAGGVVATAEGGFHLTARRSDGPGSPRRYIDPLPLLSGACFTVKLVPVPPSANLTPVDAGSP